MTLSEVGTKRTYTDNNYFCGEIVYNIPDDSDRTLMLSVENYWCSFEVYLDAEKVYSYSDVAERDGTNRQWIKLPGDARGKRLLLKAWGARRFCQSDHERRYLYRKQRCGSVQFH